MRSVVQRLACTTHSINGPNSIPRVMGTDRSTLSPLAVTVIAWVLGVHEVLQPVPTVDFYSEEGQVWDRFTHTQEPLSLLRLQT